MLRIVWENSPKLTVFRISLQVILSILPLIPIYLLKLLLDVFSEEKTGDFSYILWILAGFAVVKILVILCNNLSSYASQIQSDILSDVMSKKLLEKAIHTDLTYFDIDAYHDVYQRAQWQQGRPTQVLNMVMQLMQNSITLVAIIGVLFTLHWGVALILFLIALPTMVIRWYFSNKTVRLKEIQTPMERKASYYQTILTNSQYAKEVRIFAFGEHLLQTFLELRRAIREKKKTLHLNQSLSLSIAQSLEATAIIGALVIIARRAYLGLLSVGDVAMYYQLFHKGQSSINSLLRNLVIIQENKLHIRHLFDFFELENKITSPVKPLPFPTRVEELSLENIFFTYPNSKRTILKGISLQMNRGEIIAIVGENGSGKTTLAKLLNRLYDPTNGTIAINGSPITQFDLDELRKRITVLFQQFGKYHISIKENIEIADVHHPSDSERLDTAIGLATAKQFIHQLPRQLDTQLGRAFRHGEELSGGQWQKLALSRAFYKEADIIILDEPTSHIDPLAEAAIFDNLRTAAQDKILILITHRIYNLKMCDRILVMENGHIVEQGHHEVLMEKEGKYHELFSKQN